VPGRKRTDHARGFIGLGHIGSDMAKSLVAPPFELTVFDVAPALSAVSRESPGWPAPLRCGRHSEIVGVCVRDDVQLRAALTGPDGLLEGIGSAESSSFTALYAARRSASSHARLPNRASISSTRR